MKKSRWIMGVLAAFFSLCSLPVLAEKAKNPAVSLDEITVTANKMEEDVQRVPQSISVINETDIEEMGLQDSKDVFDQIPGMLATPDHGIGVTFRGLKRSMFTENNPVVVYVDGVPVANIYGFDFSLVNVERIEVLRGPQGTLYGKDAIGGVINVITKDPDNSWHGRIGAEYSSWNTWRTLANVNGPIAKDKLFLGVSGQYDKTDGWIKNEYPGANEDVGRRSKHDVNGYLLFTPSDRLRVRLGIDSWEDSSHSRNEVGLPYDYMGTGSGYKNLNDFHRDMAEHLYMDMEPDETIRVNAQNLSVSYDFDRFKLKSITTHRVRDIDGLYDEDGSANSPMGMDGLIMFGDKTLTTWTEELRLTSSNTTGFRWIGGVYLDKDETEGALGMQFPGAMMASPVNLEQQSVYDEDAKTQAVFGQVMLPFGQNFELTLGGRYQHIAKKIHQDLYMVPVQGAFKANVTGMNPMFAYDGDKTWNVFLPKVALAWFVNGNYTAYASFSQGYMPGGFNSFAMAGGTAENTFEPQKSTNYEIGLKTDHDKWRLNLAAFYMDIADIHIYKAIGNMWLTDNADKAHCLGAELEAAWLPVKGLELSAGLSVMQAEYDDYDLGTNPFDPSGGTIKLDGKDMEGSPNHTLRVSASYHHPSGLYGRMDVRHVGNVYYYDNVAQNLQKADTYTLANARLGWLYGNWDVYAFVRNATDEKYIDAFNSNGMEGGKAGFGDPRAIGVGLSYSF